MCCLIVTQEHTAVFAASEHRLSSERAESGVSGDASMSRHARFASVSRHARPCHSLLAARAAAMATAEQWRSLCRQAMPVLEACAQCVCPSWRWRCTMQRFKLSAETPSAAQSFFCASHVRFPDVSKTPLEAWEQFGPAWYGTARGGPLRQRRSKTKKTYPTSIASRVSCHERGRLRRVGVFAGG